MLLQELRQNLVQMEDGILFSIIERLHYPFNKDIYVDGDSLLERLLYNVESAYRHAVSSTSTVQDTPTGCPFILPAPLTTNSSGIATINLNRASLTLFLLTLNTM